MTEKPAFLQGFYPFEGQGLHSPQPFSTPINYQVPFDKRSQFVYFRAGNSSSEMVCVVVLRDGKPTRYFPIPAKGAVHVPLAVVEDMHPGTQVELRIAAPEGQTGTLVIDLGLMEF
jgi:assimilatory nitrate reductase catalytic subunit